MPHGIPVGIEDIIDTADMPTALGSAIYATRRPEWDAACVAAIRAAGGIILGKTVTTEFAYSTPGRTRNPHGLEHAPGGSSSGSAAAVADFLVPLALGAPCLAVPVARGPHGMPVGVQRVAAVGDDERLLRVGAGVAPVLAGA